MEMETRRFGRIEIEEDKIITLTRGLLGFPEQLKYILLPHRKDSPLFWLQSVERPELAFVVMSPTVFCSNYSFDLPDPVQKELKVERPEQVNVLVLLTVPPGNPQGITANLLGPVVINADKRLGCQIVLDPNVYPVQFPLMKDRDNRKSETRPAAAEAAAGGG
jgi:flagellar assembly factor FliW